VRKALFVILLLNFSSVLAQDIVPSVHLRPSFELEQATATVLAQDVFGQIWFGTQNGVRVWDGLNVTNPSECTSYVMAIHARDSSVYFLDVTSVRKINLLTGKELKYELPYADYRSCSFEDEFIVIKSSNDNDVLALNYEFMKIDSPMALSKDERHILGSYEFFIDKRNNGYVASDGDTVAIVESLVNDIVIYNNSQAFISTQEGLVEYKLEGGQLSKHLHLPNQRIEQFLVDENNNLWVSTADNGIYMFHKTMLANSYYTLTTNGQESISGWRFFSIKNEVYCCTSDGIKRISEMARESTLEKATKGVFCISALATDDFVLIGTAQKGVFIFQNDRLSRLYYNAERSLDNTVIEILEVNEDYVITTKWGFHVLNNKGEVLKSVPFTDKGGIYSMNIEYTGKDYLSASTDGIRRYSKTFKPIAHIGSPRIKIIGDLEFFQGDYWFATMEDGLYQWRNDSLLRRFPSSISLLNLVEVDNTLWGSGIKGVFEYDGVYYKEYNFMNGFPIKEYSQGGAFQQGDSLLYLSGVGGVFVYALNSDHSVKLPQWFVSWNDSYLTPFNEVALAYDQSTISLTPKSIALSDQNRFRFSFYDGTVWREIENGVPSTVSLSFGHTNLKFSVEDLHSGDTRIVEYNFNRDTPIWLKSWFRIALIFLGIFLFVGVYALFKFIKTRRLLKKESEERKVMQERLRISRELHDNIGARLSHIISSLDIELFKNQGSDQLSVINSFARETMDQLRETIWAVGDRTIFYSELKQRIEHYIVQTNSIATCNISMEDLSQIDFELNATQTINLFRIVQECINNALKYSQAKDVKVTFRDFDKSVSITVQDNGIGFNVSESRKLGSGLIGLEQRANEINATFNITSNLGEGAEAIVVFGT